MALCKIRHGYGRNPSTVETSFASTSLRAMMDSSQSHAGLLAESQRTPGKAMLDFPQTSWSFLTC